MLLPPSQSNSRYHAAKNAVLESLPKDCSEEQREQALSEFYRGWLSQESQRQATYSSEWRNRNWEGIFLGARLHYEKIISRISRSFSSKSNLRGGSRED